jgi:hypothetical protein
MTARDVAFRLAPGRVYTVAEGGLFGWSLQARLDCVTGRPVLECLENSRMSGHLHYTLDEGGTRRSLRVSGACWCYRPTALHRNGNALSRSTSGTTGPLPRTCLSVASHETPTPLSRRSQKHSSTVRAGTTPRRRCRRRGDIRRTGTALSRVLPPAALGREAGIGYRRETVGAGHLGAVVAAAADAPPTHTGALRASWYECRSLDVFRAVRESRDQIAARRPEAGDQ